MTDPTDLEALAARCEAARGPDRELDGEIACWLWQRQWGRKKPKDIPVDLYTASLDAAMTLVPEGFRSMLSEWDDEKHLRLKGAWQAILSKTGSRDCGFDPAFKTRCEHASTPALALCAAALRAMKEKDGG